MRSDGGREPLGYDIGPDEENNFSIQADGESYNEDPTFTENTLDFGHNSRSIKHSSDRYWSGSCLGIPKYYHELYRLKTFTTSNWKQSYHVRPADLAKNGFLYYGPGDKVKCVFCLKTLYNWEQGDSVEQEHRRHYPFCAFVRGECERLNVPILSKENIEAGLGLQIKQENTRSEDFTMAGQVTGYKTQPEQPTRTLPSPTFSDFSDRLASFQSWPRYFSQSKPTPEKLAKAGFYNLYMEDHVRCFSCELVLKDWTLLQDPWVEHTRKSPTCDHVISVKGSEFVKRVTSQPDVNNLNQGISNMTISQETESPKPYRSRHGENPISYKQEGQCRSPYDKLTAAYREEERDKILINAIQFIFNVPETLIRHTIADVRKREGPQYEIKVEYLASLVI